jgi:hypothetical protein
MIRFLALPLLLIALLLVAPVQADEPNNPAATAQAAQATVNAAWGQATAQAEQATAQAIQATAEAHATVQAAQAQAQATAQALEVRATTQALDAQATREAHAASLDATSTADAQELRATTQAAILEQKQLLAELNRRAIERDATQQNLIIGGGLFLLLVVVATIVWRARRSTPTGTRSPTSEPIGEIIEGEFEDVDTRQPIALLPAPGGTTTAPPRPRLVARPLPPTEKSPWSSAEIEELLIGDET